MIDQFVLKIGNINIPQKQVAQGLSMIDALDETLDTATVIIAPAKRQEVFPMWENVWLTIDGVTRTYMVSEDSVDMISKQPLLFKHTVQLIEPTKYLDVLPCDNLTFTKPSNQLSYPDDLEGKNASLWHVLRRIRMCAQLRLENATEPFPFEIDPAVESELKSIEAPQFFLNVGNVRDAVNQVLKYINAVARCWIAEDGTLMLACDRFNQRNNLISDNHVDLTKGFITNYGASQSIQDYASEVQTYVSNLTTDSENADQAVIVYPAEGNWASVRSEDNGGVLTTENMCIFTPSPISKVIKLEMWLGFGRHVGVWIDKKNASADVTELLVTSEVYKTLERKTEWELVTHTDGTQEWKPIKLGKDCAIVYDYLGNKLYGLSEKWKTLNVFSRAVIDSIAAYISFKSGTYTTGILESEPTDVDNPILFDSDNLEKTMYRITYLSTTDGRLSSEKDELTIREAMINVNQSTNLTNNIALGQNMQGLVQRLGQDEKLYTVRFKNYQTVWKIGDYTSDGYIVTKRGISIYNDVVIGNMTLNKNFNRRSQFVDLDSEIRQFVIPAKENSLTRHSLIKQYVYFGTQQMESGSGSIFTSRVFGYSLTSRSEETDNYNPNVFMIQSDDFAGNIVGAVDSKSFGNSIAFTFGFDDNRSAGNRVYEEDDKHVEQAVPYTKNGGLQTLKLQLANKMSISASWEDATTYAKRLPLLTKPTSADLLKEVITSPVNNKLKLYKDPGEIWRCTAQIHFLQNPDDQGEFIFGNAYAENHPWIQEIKEKDLYLYSLPIGDKFQPYDTLAIPSTATRIGRLPSSSYTVIDISNLTKNLQATQSWCIGEDATKQIYVAYNPARNTETVADKIYMTFYGQKIRGG